MQNDFTELKNVFRVKIDILDKNISYISNQTFGSYGEAWQYALRESPNFGNCGFCVIECEEPQLKLSTNFDSECQGVAL